MLYDTGADSCCLSEELFHQIWPKTSLPKPNPTRKFKATGGQQLNVIGKFEVPLVIGRKTVQHPFFVIRDLAEPAILGINFIEKHSLRYNPTKWTFCWKLDKQNTWDTGTLEGTEPTNHSTFYRNGC